MRWASADELGDDAVPVEELARVAPLETRDRIRWVEGFALDDGRPVWIPAMLVHLGLPVAVYGYPTVRENDGLAMSSRNALLTPEERAAAPALNRVLRAAAASIGDGGQVETALADAREELTSAGFGPIDYLAYVDGATLEPLDAFKSGGRLIAATFLGKVRLIDNLSVE